MLNVGWMSPVLSVFRCKNAAVTDCLQRYITLPQLANILFWSIYQGQNTMFSTGLKTKVMCKWFDLFFLLFSCSEDSDSICCALFLSLRVNSAQSWCSSTSSRDERVQNRHKLKEEKDLIWCFCNGSAVLLSGVTLCTGTGWRTAFWSDPGVALGIRLWPWAVNNVLFYSRLVFFPRVDETNDLFWTLWWKMCRGVDCNTFCLSKCDSVGFFFC